MAAEGWGEGGFEYTVFVPLQRGRLTMEAEGG